VAVAKKVSETRRFLRANFFMAEEYQLVKPPAIRRAALLAI
jgi:hypothetical protein